MAFLKKFFEKFKTRKSEIAFLNLLGILLFYFIFWCGNAACTAHILEFELLLSIGKVLFNLVYYILFFWFLTVCFTENGFIFYKKADASPFATFFERFHVKKILLLLVVQVVFDLLRIFSIEFAQEYSFIWQDLFVAIRWGLFYTILQYREEESFLKKKKLVLIVAAVILLMLGVSVCLNLKGLAELHFWTKRFDPESQNYLHPFENFQFERASGNLVLEACIGAILCVFHMASIDESKNFPIEKLDLFLKIPMRSCFLLVIGLLMIGIRYFVFPYDVFATWSGPNSYWQTYVKEKEFFVEDAGFVMEKMVGYGKKEIYYKDYNYKVYYANFEEKDLVKQFKPYYDGEYAKYTIENLSVEVRANRAICYGGKDEGKVILFEEIAKQSKNDLLIQVCERMIEEGNVVAFDFAHEYLLCHDSAFIEPYIERYAEGKFNHYEERFIEECSYSKDYVMGIAKRAIRGRY